MNKSRIKDKIVWHRIAINLFVVFCLTLITTPIHAKNIPIGDLVTIVNNNQLVGYGIVVGLAGSGDINRELLDEISSKTIQGFGINKPSKPSAFIKAENVAAVMLTANIPPNYKQGMRVDFTLTSLGDATSLEGGILMQTPLLGLNQEVYAIAQGPISTVGFTEDGKEQDCIIATIFGGALVEREIIGILAPKNSAKLLLRNANRISTERLVKTINKKYPDTAQVLDLMSLRVKIPQDSTTAEFLTRLFSIEVGSVK